MSLVVASVRVKVNGQVAGALTICSEKADTFDDEMMGLLAHVAEDVGRALASFAEKDSRRWVARASGTGGGIRDQLKKEFDLIFSNDRFRRAVEGTTEAMALVVEVRDPYTAGHQRRVEQLAGAIAAELGLSQEKLTALRLAALLHDLGKLAIPAEILTKPGRLSEVEIEVVRTHSQVGYDILKRIDFPWPVAGIVLQHHERIDGSGYPQGLRGEEIGLEALILAVADVVEAMAAQRP